jgi:hypothetical protein
LGRSGRLREEEEEDLKREEGRKFTAEGGRSRDGSQILTAPVQSWLGKENKPLIPEIFLISFFDELDQFLVYIIYIFLRIYLIMFLNTMAKIFRRNGVATAN